MTKKEYQEYEEAFAEGVKHLLDGHFSPGYWNCPECEGELDDDRVCVDCGVDTFQYSEEGYFSWGSCDICGTYLGGTRTDCIAWGKNARDGGKPYDDFETGGFKTNNGDWIPKKLVTAPIREPWHDDFKVELTVCDDCLYYVEYGHLDDMTMLEVESDEEE